MTHQHLQTSIERKTNFGVGLFSVDILFLTAVVEDPNRCRGFLDRPERPGVRGRLGVERRHHLHRISVVREPDAFNFFECRAAFDKPFAAGSGCRASPITGATSRERTAVRWSGTVTATGTTRAAAPRGSTSASTSTVSVRAWSRQGGGVHSWPR